MATVAPLFVLFVAAPYGGGCRRAHETEMACVSIPPFDGQAALHECEAFVKLGPKPACGGNAERAALYLRERLTGFGVEAWVDRFEDAVPGGTGTFRNVIGRIPGDTNRIVIIAAHYDTKTGISDDFSGANDSGSGVGAVLVLMKILSGARSGGGAEIQSAFLDGEECQREYGPIDGLHGSRHLARALVDSGAARKVKAFILLDMIGDRDLTVTIPRNGTSGLISAVLKAAHFEGVRGRFSLYSGGILDDHQPFLDAGIPAVDLIDFQYGCTPGGNEYWHTPADTLDKLDKASLDAVGRVVLRVIAGLE